jgi:TPR repeat protein
MHLSDGTRSRAATLAIILAPSIMNAWPASAMSPEANHEAVELQKQQNWTGLADLAGKAIAADAKDGWAWFDAGLAADGLGRKGEAIEAYETALPLLTGMGHDNVVQVLAQDYAAEGLRDKLAALHRQVAASDPALARSLQAQFAALLPKPTPPAVALDLPDVSPQSLAVLTADTRQHWRADAVPVQVQVRALDNGAGFETRVDYLSPSGHAGLFVTRTASGVSTLPVDNPTWTMGAIPDHFLPLAQAVARVPGRPGAGLVEHAYLFRASRDPANAADLVWTIALKTTAAEASLVAAYIMPKEEFDRLLAAAGGGDPHAQYSLAHVYLTGIAGPPDPGQAAAWLTKAAEQGYPEAENKLGQYYQFGTAVPADAKAAAHWYEKAADAGDINGEFNLGLLYETGLGVPQDWLKAEHWIIAAARQGSQAAIAEYGIVHQGAQREAHRRELAAQQQQQTRAHCGVTQVYGPNGHCQINVTVMNHMMNIAVHPELPPNRVP